jgi:hypothetical protein
MPKNVPLSESLSIHDLEAGLRNGRWMGEGNGDQTGPSAQTLRSARSARRDRRVMAARGQLRTFSRRATGRRS